VQYAACQPDINDEFDTNAQLRQDAPSFLEDTKSTLDYVSAGCVCVIENQLLRRQVCRRSGSKGRDYPRLAWIARIC
jgi:hypothetical protein